MGHSEAAIPARGDPASEPRLPELRGGARVSRYRPQDDGPRRAQGADGGRTHRANHAEDELALKQS